MNYNTLKMADVFPQMIKFCEMVFLRNKFKKTVRNNLLTWVEALNTNTIQSVLGQVGQIVQVVNLYPTIAAELEKHPFDLYDQEFDDFTRVEQTDDLFHEFVGELNLHRPEK